MGIATCPSCGGEMSVAALRCPSCRRFNPHARIDLAGFIGGLLVVLGLLLYIARQ